MKELEYGSTLRGRLARGRRSQLGTYVDFTVGDVGFGRFLAYEVLTSLLGPLPGALGLYLRQKTYPVLFARCGRKAVFGRDVVLRHAKRIEIGANVTIDDNSVIDAHGAGPQGVVLEDGVIVNRNCMIQAKGGPVRLGRGTSIGSYSMITSLDGVEIADHVLIAGGCHLNAASYRFDDPETPILFQGATAEGPIRIGTGSYLGGGVLVMAAITIGAGAVIRPGSVVEHDVPPGAIASGVPARVVGTRAGRQVLGGSRDR